MSSPSSLLMGKPVKIQHTVGQIFIDNLSQICDEFAYSIHPKEKPHRSALQSRYRTYRM